MNSSRVFIATLILGAVLGPAWADSIGMFEGYWRSNTGAYINVQRVKQDFQLRVFSGKKLIGTSTACVLDNLDDSFSFRYTWKGEQIYGTYTRSTDTIKVANAAGTWKSSWRRYERGD